MKELIDSHTYIVELTPVKQKAENLRERLDTFIEKYNRIIDAGYCVSIPDNPMGHLSFQGTEIIGEYSLRVPPDQVLYHLNTFHSIQEVDEILNDCKNLGIRNILIISGDGSDRLPKLQPEDVKADTDSVTTVELARYISENYPGVFDLGAAFNQYEPESFEFNKLERKMDSGIQFVITQPVVGKDDVLRKLIGYGIPVFLEAWMSKNTTLLADCIGYDLPEEYTHEPLEVLRDLTRKYPQCGFYTAILGFKKQFDMLSGIWTAEEAS